MRILTSVIVLALGGCSMLQPQPLPAPEPIVKTVTEYKTLEIYQPPLPKAISLQDVEFFVLTEKNFEEAGITEDKITLIKASEEMKIHSPQYKNHEWEIFPFLFESSKPTIKLNWENSDFKWINMEELESYETVPSLQKVLLNLL